MKKRIALALALCLMLCLVACSEGSGEPTESTQPSTEATTPSTQGADATESTGAAETPSHTVTVLDNEGNPIANAFVQLCLLGDEGTCTPNMTNAEGVAEYYLAEGEYKVTFVTMPAGYTYVDETQEFHFEDGATTMTIILKKAE